LGVMSVPTCVESLLSTIRPCLIGATIAVLLVLVNSTQVAAHKPLWSDGDKPMHIPNLVTSFAVYRDIEWHDLFRFPGWWVRIHTFFSHGPQLLAAVGVAAATLAFVVGRRIALL